MSGEIDILGLEEGVVDDSTVPRSIAEPRSVEDPSYLGKRWTEFFGDRGLYECTTGIPSGLPDELETDVETDVEIFEPTRGVVPRDTPFPWHRPGYTGAKQWAGHEYTAKVMKGNPLVGEKPLGPNHTIGQDQASGPDQTLGQEPPPSAAGEEPSSSTQDPWQDFPGRPKEIIPDYDYNINGLEPVKSGSQYKWKDLPPDFELKPLGLNVRELRKMWDMFIKIGKDHIINKAADENLYEDLKFMWRHDAPGLPTTDPDRINDLPLPAWIDELRPKGYDETVPTTQYDIDTKMSQENWRKYKYYMIEDPQRGFDEAVAEDEGLDINAPYNLTPQILNNYRNILYMIDQRNQVDLKAFKEHLGPEEMARMNKGNMTGEDWPTELSIYD